MNKKESLEFSSQRLLRFQTYLLLLQVQQQLIVIALKYDIKYFRQLIGFSIKNHFLWLSSHGTSSLF